MRFGTWLDAMPIVVHRGWRVTKAGEIRDQRGFCPICAIANEVDSKFTHRTDDREAIREVLGDDYYGDGGSDIIVHAADEPSYPLRRTLMNALMMEIPD